MRSCCNHTKKTKYCVRKQDNKKFKLPRKFSKQKCKKPKGFTMKSSCAPYKYCRKTKQKGGKTRLKNINKKKLKICSLNPKTGYYRNGYCETGPNDIGTHTVCSKIDDKFLQYTKSKKNDLSSVVKPGDKWCLCESRWNQAYKDNLAPDVVLEATNIKTDKTIINNIRNHYKKMRMKQYSNRHKKQHKKTIKKTI